MPQMNLRETEIFIGGIKIEVGDGNLTYTENRPLIYTTEGNMLADVREDDEKPLELKLDFIWKRATATPMEIRDMIKGAVGSVSSDADSPCRPYAVDIMIKYRSNCTLPATYRQITFPDFRYETYESDMKAGKISVAGHCNVLKPLPALVVV